MFTVASRMRCCHQCPVVGLTRDAERWWRDENGSRTSVLTATTSSSVHRPCRSSSVMQRRSVGVDIEGAPTP